MRVCVRCVGGNRSYFPPLNVSLFGNIQYNTIRLFSLRIKFMKKIKKNKMEKMENGADEQEKEIKETETKKNI